MNSLQLIGSILIWIGGFLTGIGTAGAIVNYALKRRLLIRAPETEK